MKPCRVCDQSECLWCPHRRVRIRREPRGRRFADAKGESPVPPEPTPFLPGTPEKMAVMTWRISQRYSAFHPDDAVGVPLQFGYDPDE